MNNSQLIFISSIYDFKDAYSKQPEFFSYPQLVRENGYHIDNMSVFTNSTSTQNSIEVKNTIFVTDEKHRICPRHSLDKINFINCIFTKRLFFDKDVKSMYFDNCIFLENFTFGTFVWNNTISFTRCSMNILSVYDSSLEKLDIHSSYINYLEVNSIEATTVSVSYSDINHLTFCDNKYKTLRFNPHQLIKANPGTSDFTSQLEKSIAYQRKGNNIKYFHFPDTTQSIKTNIHYAWVDIQNIHIRLKEYLTEIYKINKGKVDSGSYTSTLYKLKTIEFLQNETYYRLYPESIHAFETVTKKIIYRKRLIKPFVLFLDKLMYVKNNIKFMIFAITFFSGIYWLFGTFKVGENSNVELSFVDSLYFSAITFFTIGYGEITPENTMKLFAASEGFFGVILSGLFIVILARYFLGK